MLVVAVVMWHVGREIVANTVTIVKSFLAVRQGGIYIQYLLSRRFTIGLPLPQKPNAKTVVRWDSKNAIFLSSDTVSLILAET